MAGTSQAAGMIPAEENSVVLNFPEFKDAVPKLQELCRASVRRQLLSAVLEENPGLPDPNKVYSITKPFKSEAHCAIIKRRIRRRRPRRLEVLTTEKMIQGISCFRGNYKTIFLFFTDDYDEVLTYKINRNRKPADKANSPRNKMPISYIDDEDSDESDSEESIDVPDMTTAPDRNPPGLESFYLMDVGFNENDERIFCSVDRRGLNIQFMESQYQMFPNVTVRTLMENKIQKLPLPSDLKDFLNYYREWGEFIPKLGMKFTPRSRVMTSVRELQLTASKQNA